MTKRSSRRLVGGFGLVGVAMASLMLLSAPSASATTTRNEFDIALTATQTYTGSWSWVYTPSSLSGGVALKGSSGSQVTITFTTSTSDVPIVYCSKHPEGTATGVTGQNQWRIDGGAWQVFADYAASASAPTACAQPATSTAGSHTIDIQAAGGKKVIVDYLEGPDLDAPTTTTTSTTSTTAPPTTTTNPIDGPCRWEWGGIQELDPQPCPEGTSVSLTSASRPAAGRPIGGADVVAVGLLLLSGWAVLRAIGQRQAD